MRLEQVDPFTEALCVVSMYFQYVARFCSWSHLYTDNLITHNLTTVVSRLTHCELTCIMKLYSVLIQLLCSHCLSVYDVSYFLILKI